MNGTCLYHKYRGSELRRLLVIPILLRRDVIHACHNQPTDGYMGIEKTLANMKQRYWWPGVRRSVAAYVSSFVLWQLNKLLPGQQRGMLKSISPPA